MRKKIQILLCRIRIWCIWYQIFFSDISEDIERKLIKKFKKSLPHTIPSIKQNLSLPIQSYQMNFTPSSFWNIMPVFEDNLLFPSVSPLIIHITLLHIRISFMTDNNFPIIPHNKIILMYITHIPKIYNTS